MKLHFYILENHYREKPTFKCSECEVEEKPKTYKPVNRFPSGYYYSTVSKDNIGVVQGRYDRILILTEKDDELAKRLLSESINKEIEYKNKEIEELQEKLDALNEMVVK